MSVDLLLVCVSFVGAHFLRFGGTPPVSMLEGVVYGLPVVGILKVAVFYWFRLYRSLWRHAGTPDAVRLVKASTVASGGLLLVSVLLSGTAPLPIALLALDWMLTTLATGGYRFGRRVLNQRHGAGGAEQRRVLIYGADANGVFLLRYLRHAAPAASVVGFLDPNHDGRQLRGRPVVDAPTAVEADALLIPVLPSTFEGHSAEERAEIADVCASLDLSCQQFRPAMGSAVSTALPEPVERAPSRRE